MKLLISISTKVEQKAAAFQSDLMNCHAFSVSNLGTSNVRFRFLADGGEVLLKPGEAIPFESVMDAPLTKDVLDGGFEPNPDTLPADRVDQAMIIKKIGVYGDC